MNGIKLDINDKTGEVTIQQRPVIKPKEKTDEHGFDMGDVCIHGEQCPLCISIENEDVIYNGIFCSHESVPQTPEGCNVFRFHRCPDGQWYKDKPRLPEMTPNIDDIEKQEIEIEHED